MLDLKALPTEKRNPDTMSLDTMSPLQIATAMNSEDFKAVSAVTGVLSAVATAIEWGAAALKVGGRIIYIGAGTSGRIGALDAVECPPTFGVSSDTVSALIAGGECAFFRAAEGAEDDGDRGIIDLKRINFGQHDMLVGLAASGRTPYVLAALKYARGLTCRTVSIACNPRSKISNVAELAIEPVPGPEVLTGSTRLKAGTVQKLVLNMISTGSMVGAGKVYQNLMVDVRQTNEKLRVRAQNIVMETTNCRHEEAIETLSAAGGSAKIAIVMKLFDCDADAARERIKANGGHIRAGASSEGKL